MRRWSSIAVAAITVGTVGVAEAAQPPALKKSPPAELWSKYPAGEERLRSTPRSDPPRPSAEPNRSPPIAPAATSDRPIAVFAAAGSAVLVLVAVGLVLVARRPGRRPEHLAEVVVLTPRRETAAERGQEIRAQAEALVAQFGTPARAATGAPARSALRECDKYAPSFPQGERGHLSTPSEHTPSVTGTTSENVEPSLAEEKAQAPAYADFGSRVAGILDAAEQTAEQIRAEARDDAAALRQDAEAASAARRDQLEREADKLRSEAETYAAETRKTGESYATQHRREAEEQAARTLSDAEAQARATREAAEEMAAQIETTGRQRQEQLQEATGTMEARLQRAVGGLREMTAQLESLLGAQPPSSDETIVEALDSRRQVHSG